MSDRLFTCDGCGETFPASNTVEDAMEEARGLFGPSLDATHNASLCDDCFVEFIPWAQAEGFVQGGAKS